MSFACIVMMMFLGSSMVISFVLQPSKEEPAASDISDSQRRCQRESLQSLRKGLLSALNLQVEPRLPAGGLDSVRAQWRSTFSGTALQGKASSVPAASGYSVSPDDENSTSQECCSMATEVSMKDLGWDDWVIHPSSLTIVQCALCNPKASSTVQSPSAHTSVQDADSQVQAPCCQPTSEDMVPVLYMDEFNTVVISSLQLTRSCGCRSGNIQPPVEG